MESEWRIDKFNGKQNFCPVCTSSQRRQVFREFIHPWKLVRGYSLSRRPFHQCYVTSATAYTRASRIRLVRRRSGNGGTTALILQRMPRCWYQWPSVLRIGSRSRAAKVQWTRDETFWGAPGRGFCVARHQNVLMKWVFAILCFRAWP